MVRVKGFDPTHKATVELAPSASNHGQKQIALLPMLMKREKAAGAGRKAKLNVQPFIPSG